ncbi:MAG: DUF1501 domain-containing protein [Planctomycetales bacterium]|nr:DUF1501 domain-containing protein [Planctomycetales bacterium]
MAIHKTCDGWRRRDFLKVGVAGAAGLSLASYLRLAEAGQVSSGKATSAIFINLPGGPSHMDTFDLKPDAPAEYRGTFNPIKTNAAGVEISEHLPKLAQCADKFAILRGVSHTLGAHQLGSEYVNTGSRPLPSLEYPGYAAVVAKELQAPSDLPPAVSIPNANQRAGFLGVKYAPLNTNSTPRPGQPFSVRGIGMSNGLTIADVEKRHSLLRDLDTAFTGFESNSQLLDGLDRFSQQAYEMITSKRTREAFDVSKESPKFAEPFGEDTFGQSCLLATRLIESGVRFVTLSTGGWDTHQDNFTRLKDRLLPPLDTGLAALLNGLEQKGLLDSTAVFVTGEFGRTPKINSRSTEGGRDHYPRCMFMLMAGGGVRGGQAVGESDDKATLPRHEAISPDDVAASFYHALGIDHTKEYHTSTGRPIMIVRDGRVLPQLFA